MFVLYIYIEKERLLEGTQRLYTSASGFLEWRVFRETIPNRPQANSLSEIACSPRLYCIIVKGELHSKNKLYSYETSYFNELNPEILQCSYL